MADSSAQAPPLVGQKEMKQEPADQLDLPPAIEARAGWTTQPLDTRPDARTGNTADRERRQTVGTAAEPPNCDTSAHNAHAESHAMECSRQKLCMELHSRMLAEWVRML